MVARECLLLSNEHRGRPVDQNAVAKLFNLLRDVTHYGNDPSLSEIVTPLMHDQFVYQANPFVEMNRAIAVLGTGWANFPEYDWTYTNSGRAPRTCTYCWRL